jgi:hypothetical protein
MVIRSLHSFLRLASFPKHREHSAVVAAAERGVPTVAELARAALQTFEAQQFAAAIVLTRAAVETNAALWYLDEKVGTALKHKKLGDLDDCVMSLLSGTYAWEEFPNPIRVGKLVECVERSGPGFREQYNTLSEYAHPNAHGTTGLYSYDDRENIFVDFGPQDRNTKPAKAICITNLSVTLMLFRAHLQPPFGAYAGFRGTVRERNTAPAHC